MLNEMMRNGSGYPDFTAYNGMMNPNPGEIWTQGDRDDDYWVLLAVNNNVCTGLKLTNRDMDGSISVTCREVMFTNPAMMGYVFRNRLGCYVKTLPKKEFDALRKSADDVLGFTLAENPAEIKEQEDLKKQLEEARFDLKMHENSYAMLAESIEELQDKLDACQVYKDMYHELIDKLITAKAGAVI